jgi:hypothetical protein
VVDRRRVLRSAPVANARARESDASCVSQGIGLTSRIESLQLSGPTLVRARARTHSRGYDACGWRGSRAVPVSARVSADTLHLGFSDFCFDNFDILR